MFLFLAQWRARLEHGKRDAIEADAMIERLAEDQGPLHLFLPLCSGLIDLGQARDGSTGADRQNRRQAGNAQQPPIHGFLQKFMECSISGKLS